MVREGNILGHKIKFESVIPKEKKVLKLIDY